MTQMGLWLWQISRSILRGTGAAERLVCGGMGL